MLVMLAVGGSGINISMASTEGRGVSVAPFFAVFTPPPLGPRDGWIRILEQGILKGEISLYC